MDEAFIVVTVISSLFGILGLLILDRNWFRRERFKFDMDLQKQTASLNFKKMRRDLGLDQKIPPFRNPQASVGDIAGGLLPLLKNINPDQLGAIADILGGQGESETEGGGGQFDGLLDFAAKNPDLIKGFLKGAGEKVTGSDESKLL
jgi:hypothetical protein